MQWTETNSTSLMNCAPARVQFALEQKRLVRSSCSAFEESALGARRSSWGHYRPTSSSVGRALGARSSTTMCPETRCLGPCCHLRFCWRRWCPAACQCQGPKATMSSGWSSLAPRVFGGRSWADGQGPHGGPPAAFVCCRWAAAGSPHSPSGGPSSPHRQRQA